jgi:peptidoglycan/xylan/chitin deacetylase (PgdA/CDA1 family)
MKRREFLKKGVISTFAVGGVSGLSAQTTTGNDRSPIPLSQGKFPGRFWADGIRLVISISMQFEAGAQADRGAESPFPKIDPKFEDLPAAKWFDYGFKEGIPRLLDLFDRRNIKVTSHMVGAAVDRNPELAREIVQRGHEASGHGQTWTPQYSMSPEEECASYQANIHSILRATGTRPFGFNAFWMRGTPHTLEILQGLGFIYYIDDLSRDEPFLISVKGKPFVVIPYTLGMNDIEDYEARNFSTQAYASDLRNEFDLLYAEAGKRRRMMSVSAHDRIAGRPAQAKVLEDFIIYAQKHPGVAFLRKDEIAQFALTSPLTLREGI